MERIGIFTGNLYTQEDYDNHRIHECCICLSPSLEHEDAYQNAKERQQTSKITRCTGCFECEESRKYNYGERNVAVR